MQTLTRRRERATQTEKATETVKAQAYHYPAHATGVCAGCDAQAERERQLNWAKGARRP